VKHGHLKSEATDSVHGSELIHDEASQIIHDVEKHTKEAPPHF